MQQSLFAKKLKKYIFVIDIACDFSNEKCIYIEFLKLNLSLLLSNIVNLNIFQISIIGLIISNTGIDFTFSILMT